MMDALTAFDVIAIVLVILSTLMALARGFLRELATLGAFIAALAAAYYINLYLNRALTDALPETLPDWSATALLFVGTFLVIYVAVAWFGANLSKTIQGVDGVGLVDRLAGGVFGLARGAVVLVFFIYLLNLAMDQDQIPEFISQSQTYPLIERGADYLAAQVPESAAPPRPSATLDADATAE
ncbi:MAG: CvpA family protein [Henriciella sp.]